MHELRDPKDEHPSDFHCNFEHDCVSVSSQLSAFSSLKDHRENTDIPDLFNTDFSVDPVVNGAWMDDFVPVELLPGTAACVPHGDKRA